MRYDDTAMDFYPVLTPGDMRAAEQAAFAAGVPGMLLMEQAALAVADALEHALGGECRGKRVLFLCGTGNNGGDGLAAARIFAMRGGQAEIWLSGTPGTADAQMNLNWCRLLGLDILNLRETAEADMPFAGEAPRAHFDGYVDALLGTGLRGRPDALTERMLHAPAFDCGEHPVIAVDIPSGIDGRTGAVYGDAYVRADVTVTFHAPKPGLYLTPDRAAVGRLEIADIGLWQMSPWRDGAGADGAQELTCETASPRALSLLPGRALNAHKGDCGRILVYAGSMGMAGAAAMCAAAAIAAGAGLTTIACSREIMPILQTLVPNAMCISAEDAAARSPAYDVLALGCGLSRGAEAGERILRLFDPAKPSVWDADALNWLSEHPMRLGRRAIMTPHPGEAARLLGWPVERVLAERLAAARALCEKYDCMAVLKSDVSILCEMQGDTPRYFLNAVGSPALAKGGSGDALTGILAVCLQDMPGDPLRAAAIACLWHGLAARIGERRYGQREMTTAQLINCLHDARRQGQLGESAD